MSYIISVMQCCLQWSIWWRCKHSTFSWTTYRRFFTDKMWYMLQEKRRKYCSCHLLLCMQKELLLFTQGGLVSAMQFDRSLSFLVFITTQ